MYIHELIFDRFDSLDGVYEEFCLREKNLEGCGIFAGLAVREGCWVEVMVVGDGRWRLGNHSEGRAGRMVLGRFLCVLVREGGSVLMGWR